MTATIDTDILVVGGGPAGLATAIAARGHGLRVLVAERAAPPVDKACGEGLLPDGVAALSRLGVVVSGAEAFPFRGLRFVDGDLAADASFSHLHGLGIRRIVLHELLAERAREAGAELLWRTPADCSDPAAPQLGGRTIRCRWLVGADSAQSRVRLAARLPVAHGASCRLGLRQHFRLQPWSELVEVHWAAHTQAYLTPVGPEELCLAVLGSDPAARLSDIATLFPALAKRLAGAETIGALRGAMSVAAALPRVTRGRIALVGDASGSVDAVTGEGLSLALRQALALGDAMAADDMALYEAAHRRLARTPRLMSRVLLFMARHGGARRQALRRLAARPRSFDRLVAAHVGAGSLARLLLDLPALALPMPDGTTGTAPHASHF